MVRLTTVFVASLAAVASAAPMQKRIAQTIADSTALWVKACTAAGGADKCNPISQTAFGTLLAAGKNCDQQDAADQMVDLAKTLKNDPEMIRLAQLFVQQPRNAPDSLQVPYCQTAPKNAELDGLFHCQFAGSDFTKFSGDQTGNLPLGVSAVSPPGSCPAKTDGPVPDGVQLNSLVQSPGTPEGSGAAASASSATGAADSADDSTADDDTTADDITADDTTADHATADDTTADDTTADDTTDDTTATAGEDNAAGGAAIAAAAPVAGAKSFTLQNGQEAQKLNAQFATLTAASSCEEGEQACVGGGFAQCVGGKFQTIQCGGGTVCAALPLVNSAGTSITCTTNADAAARIAATGATGGVTGA